MQWISFCAFFTSFIISSVSFSLPQLPLCWTLWWTLCWIFWIFRNTYTIYKVNFWKCKGFWVILCVQESAFPYSGNRCHRGLPLCIVIRFYSLLLISLRTRLLDNYLSDRFANCSRMAETACSPNDMRLNFKANVAYASSRSWLYASWGVGKYFLYFVPK